jgi:hypothetical protein
MLALVGTVMSRSPSGNVLLRDGDGVLGTHKCAQFRAPTGSRVGDAAITELHQGDTPGETEEFRQHAVNGPT